LLQPISEAIRGADLVVCSILSGNRDFEGRIHPDVRMNFLASPPLVVAYAMAGAMDIDMGRDSLARDTSGNPVHLRDLWPTQAAIDETIASCIDGQMFRKSYERVFDGDALWRSMDVPDSEQYRWDETSTCIRHPPYFEGMAREPIRSAFASGCGSTPPREWDYYRHGGILHYVIRQLAA
jgi:aconitate hydratase